MEKPWFHAGLRFECTRCGHCCTGAPGFVWVNDEEVRRLAEFLGVSPGQMQEAYTRQLGTRRSLTEKPNGDCVFYDKQRGCTVYEARPRQCRTWPFWESNLRTEADWQEAGQGCPGCGQGDLIAPEEITRRMQVIKL